MGPCSGLGLNRCVQMPPLCKPSWVPWALARSASLYPVWDSPDSPLVILRASNHCPSALLVSPGSRFRGVTICGLFP